MAERTTAVYDRQKAIRDGGQVVDQTLPLYDGTTANAIGYVGARCRAAYGDISGKAFAAADQLNVVKLDRKHYRPVMLGIRHGAGGGSATVRDRVSRFYTSTNPAGISAAGSEIAAPQTSGFTADGLELLFPAATAAAAAPKVWLLFGGPAGEDD